MEPEVEEPVEPEIPDGKQEEEQEEQAVDEVVATDTIEMQERTRANARESEQWSKELEAQGRTLNRDARSTELLSARAAEPDRRPRGITEMENTLARIESKADQLQTQTATATRSMKNQVLKFIAATLVGAILGAVIDRLSEYLLKEAGVINDEPSGAMAAAAPASDATDKFSIEPVLELDDAAFWKRVQTYADKLGASRMSQAALMRFIVGLNSDAPVLEWDAKSKLAAIDGLRNVLRDAPKGKPPKVSLIYTKVGSLTHDGKPLPRGVQARLCEIVLANVTSA